MRIQGASPSDTTSTTSCHARAARTSDSRAAVTSPCPRRLARGSKSKSAGLGGSGRVRHHQRWDRRSAAAHAHCSAKLVVSGGTAPLLLPAPVVPVAWGISKRRAPTAARTTGASVRKERRDAYIHLSLPSPRLSQDDGPRRTPPPVTILMTLTLPYAL